MLHDSIEIVSHFKLHHAILSSISITHEMSSISHKLLTQLKLSILFSRTKMPPWHRCQLNPIRHYRWSQAQPPVPFTAYRNDTSPLNPGVAHFLAICWNNYNTYHVYMNILRNPVSGYSLPTFVKFTSAPNNSVQLHAKMLEGDSNNTLYVPHVSILVPNINIPPPQNAANALATWAGSDKLLSLDNAVWGFYEKVCWNLDHFTMNDNMTWNHIAAYYGSGAAPARGQLPQDTMVNIKIQNISSNCKITISKHILLIFQYHCVKMSYHKISLNMIYHKISLTYPHKISVCDIS